MLTMLLYAIILGGLVVLLVAAAGTLREAFRKKARLRGFLVALLAGAVALVGIWAMLV